MHENHLELAEKLSHLLGDVVTVAHITQGYHWNVKGIEFSQLHEFFADIYGDIDGSIDPLAENIRKIGYDSPYLLQDFIELSCIDERRVTGDGGGTKLAAGVDGVVHAEQAELFGGVALAEVGLREFD